MAGAWNSEYFDNREPQHAPAPTPTTTATPTTPPTMYNTPKTGGGSKMIGAIIVALRLATFVFGLIALAIMGADKVDFVTYDAVDPTMYTISTVTFTISSAYKFLLAMNVIVCFYSICQLVHTIVTLAMGRGFPQRNLALAWATFLLDHVFSYMLIAAGAAGAAAAIIIRAAYGSTCGNFCVKAEASVGMTFAAWLFLAITAAFSSRHLFKLY